MNHHDSITGTNTDMTFNDYIQRMKNVFVKLTESWKRLYEKILEVQNGVKSNPSEKVLLLFNPSLYTV